MFKVYISIFLMMVFSDHAFSWGLKDLGEEAATPLTTNAKYVLFTGTAITVTLLIFEDAIIDPFQEKQVRNKA